MAQIAELEVAFTADTKSLTKGISTVKKGVEQTGQAVTQAFSKQATQSIEGTTMAVTNFNRIVQDAPFGIIGISNNLEPMIQSFNQLKRATGSTGKALKTLLVSAFTGPGALITAVSLASTALIVFGDKLFQSGEKAGSAKEQFDTMKESIDGILSSIAQFDEVTGVESQIVQTERALKTYEALKAELEKKVESGYTEAFKESNFFVQNTVRDGVEMFNKAFGTSIRLTEEEAAALEQVKEITGEIATLRARLVALQALSNTQTSQELEAQEARLKVIRDQSTDILKGKQAMEGVAQATVSTLAPAGNLGIRLQKVASEGSLAEVALRGVTIETSLSEKAGQAFVNTMTAGLAQMIMQSKTLGDGLKNLGKMLLSTALQLGISGLLTGGLTTGAGLFGSGGGLFGKLGGLFAGAAPVMGASPVSGSSIALTGEFMLSGQDLRLALDRANQFAGG